MEIRWPRAPDPAVELQESLHSAAVHLDATLEPALPAHVAAGHPGRGVVDDEELGMHDAERREEERLDCELDVAAAERLLRGQAQRWPLRWIVYTAPSGRRVEQLLYEAERREANRHVQLWHVALA